MATISSVQPGDWNVTTTWDSGTVPTSADTVQVKHAVHFSASIKAHYIHIWPGGSLTTTKGCALEDLEADFVLMDLWRELDDRRRIDLDGVKLSDNVQPSITCGNYTGADGYPIMHDLVDDGTGGIIIDDPGFLSSTAILRDIKPEGCAAAYAEKVSNAVRYITATIHIKASDLAPLGYLYRMARSPFQVMLVTHSIVIKGFIESVVPDAASVGKEYITVKVTVTEGPGA